jgi:hypothetical protein
MPSLISNDTIRVFARQRRPAVYLASPVNTYRSPRYGRLLRAVQQRFPQTRVIPARGLFRDSGYWRSVWPVFLPIISVLVFFPDGGGWIGYGVWQELHDVAALGRPVFLLRDDGRLVPLGQVTFGPIHAHDWVRFARVRACRRRVN